MTPERWNRIEEIFERSLDLTAAKRAAFLAEVCAGDAELHAEVESLLDAHRNARDFRPGGDTIRPMVEALETEYYLGSTLGNYELQSLVGRGGMGSVYRAVEISTNREVAVKILSPELFASPAARQLLSERCRQVMAIRHRNIAAVHALEHIGHADCIVMEFVDGPTLERRAGMKEALSAAWQLAAALRAAHRAGAAHGDVRAANVMIDGAGCVKLVDFSVGEASAATDWKQYRSLLRWMLAPRLTGLALAACSILLTVAGAWRFFSAPSSPAVRQLTYDSGLTTEPALSRDGKWLAFASDRGGAGGLDIWVQPFPSGVARRLTTDPADDREPAFSPDGRWIAFRSERDGGNVYRIPAAGGREQLLVPQGRRPRYSPDGKWLAYFTGEESDRFPNRVFAMPAEGGPPVPIAPGFDSAFAPVWSPDSRQLLFAGRQAGQPQPSWWLASLDGGSPMPFEIPERLRLSRFHLAAFRLIADEWTPGDRLLFTFHAGATTVLGEARISGGSLREPVRALAENGKQNVRATASPDGRLVYASVNRDQNLWLQPLPSGALTPVTVADGGMMLYPSLHQDGRLLLMSHWGPGGVDIATKDLDTGIESPLTGGMPSGSWAKFIAGGTRLAYFQEAAKAGSVFIRSVGSGQSEFLTDAAGSPWDISPDGRSVLFPSATGPERLMIATKGGTSEFLADPGADLADARFSPDGQRVAFTARDRIYIAPFPEGGQWIQASATPGAYPEWSPDGRALYFLSKADGFLCLWVQPLNGGAAHAIRHFHQYALNPGSAPHRHLRMAVSRDRIVLPLGRLSGNLFLAE